MIGRKRIMIAGGVVAVVALLWLMSRERPVAVEMAEVSARTVREYIAEDAKTRLADDYIIDMPLSGTVDAITLEEGDEVEAGGCVATVDAYGLEQQVAALEALIAQARARITSVDVEKPKPEDLASAELRIKEEHDRQAIAAKERAIAENDFRNAEREWNRVKALFESGAVSQSQYDEAERGLKNARENLERVSLASDSVKKALDIAELASQRLAGSVDDNEFMREVYRKEIENLESQLNVLKDDLAKTQIASPVKGVVLEKFVDDKRVLAAGTPLLRIGDLQTIEIECDVLSEEIVRVKVDDPVEITGKALNDRVVLGRVNRIYPSGFQKVSALGIEQQRVRTILTFDDPSENLRPGTSVDVRIITGEVKDAISVPERATFRSDGGWAVFVVEGGRARLVPVEIALKNDDWAAIRSGLQPGQIVVAEPKNELADGVRVAPL
ncbi:MAG: efflux RND transporter periplasmic adaptor subunit [Candidatus Hydrogenedentes bacterium]|nr:efflux RND transporter periplasmic adaptor subunit [Candidatus Hydrogenedentota bacterium]